jgi:hypothetical protein
MARAALHRFALLATSFSALFGCTSTAGTPAPSSGVPSPVASATDTSRAQRRGPNDPVSAQEVPPGFGTLRQDDVSLRIRSSSLQVRATPLDEFVIRLLSPDSYRAMSELRRSKSDAIAQVARRNGARDVSVWYVSFFAVERGETRFSPREFIITNVGRDFRPLDVLPLTPGFGEQRLAQNGRQDALYVFDGQLDVQQPLTVSYTTERNDEWASILPRIERERSLVKSRASAGRAP